MKNKVYTTQAILLEILADIRDKIKSGIYDGKPEQLCMLAEAASQIGEVIPDGYDSVQIDE